MKSVSSFVFVSLFYCGAVILGLWPFGRLESILDPFRIDFFLPEKQHVVPEALMTTTEIIESKGYPVEIHRVVTQDGYVLHLHRIPKSPRSPGTLNKKPVLLQHGLTGTDIVWILNSGNKSLAFLLADQGYDVWMGNYRGNTYSREHITLDPEEPQYWEYSWDEMGKYDIPAFVEYILNVTHQPKTALIGHSMAAALFYIAAIEEPHLNDKIDAIICLGPSVNNARLKSSVAQFFTPAADQIEVILKSMGIYAFLKSDSPFMQILRSICISSATGAALCKLLLFDIFGTSETFDMDLMHLMFHHYPSGGSLAEIKHWFQTFSPDDAFYRYDYGREGNLERYGTERPPEYDLSLIRTPVYIFWGENDPLASPEDVAWLADRLGNVSVSIRVDDPHFTHGDFIWSPDADRLIYAPILHLLGQFS